MSGSLYVIYLCDYAALDERLRSKGSRFTPCDLWHSVQNSLPRSACKTMGGRLDQVYGLVQIRVTFRVQV